MSIQRLKSLYSAYLYENYRTKRLHPHWRYFRDAYLADHPYCEACRTYKNLHVHLVEFANNKPFIAISNMMTLCMSREECYLRLGHGGDFAYYNPCVRDHVRRYYISPHSRFVLADAAAYCRILQPTRW